QISLLTREACQIKSKWFSGDEACDWFERRLNFPRDDLFSFEGLVTAIRNVSDGDSSRLREIVQEIDFLVLGLLNATDEDAIADITRYRQRMPTEVVGVAAWQSAEVASSKFAKDIVSF